MVEFKAMKISNIADQKTDLKRELATKWLGSKISKHIPSQLAQLALMREANMITQVTLRQRCLLLLTKRF